MATVAYSYSYNMEMVAHCYIIYNYGFRNNMETVVYSYNMETVVNSYRSNYGYWYNMATVAHSYRYNYGYRYNMATVAYSLSKPWTWRIRICLTIVDFPDSPAPVGIKTLNRKSRNLAENSKLSTEYLTYKISLTLS